MPDLKNRSHRIKYLQLRTAGIVVLFFLAVLLLWFNNANSTQAISAMVAQVRFYGEYRIGDEPW